MFKKKSLVSTNVATLFQSHNFSSLLVWYFSSFTLESVFRCWKETSDAAEQKSKVPGKKNDCENYFKHFVILFRDKCPSYKQTVTKALE